MARERARERETVINVCVNGNKQTKFEKRVSFIVKIYDDTQTLG